MRSRIVSRVAQVFSHSRQSQAHHVLGLKHEVTRLAQPSTAMVQKAISRNFQTNSERFTSRSRMFRNYCYVASASVLGAVTVLFLINHKKEVYKTFDSALDKAVIKVDNFLEKPAKYIENAIETTENNFKKTTSALLPLYEHEQLGFDHLLKMLEPHGFRRHHFEFKDRYVVRPVMFGDEYKDALLAAVGYGLSPEEAVKIVNQLQPYQVHLLPKIDPRDLLLLNEDEANVLFVTKEYNVQASDFISPYRHILSRGEQEIFIYLVKNGRSASNAFNIINKYYKEPTSTSKFRHNDDFQSAVFNALKNGFSEEEIAPIYNKLILEKLDRRDFATRLRTAVTLNNKEIIPLLAQLNIYTPTHEAALLYLISTAVPIPTAVHSISNINVDQALIISTRKFRDEAKTALGIPDHLLNDNHSWFACKEYVGALRRLIHDNVPIRTAISQLESINAIQAESVALGASVAESKRMSHEQRRTFYYHAKHGLTAASALLLPPNSHHQDTVFGYFVERGCEVNDIVRVMRDFGTQDLFNYAYSGDNFDSLLNRYFVKTGEGKMQLRIPLGPRSDSPEQESSQEAIPSSRLRP